MMQMNPKDCINMEEAIRYLGYGSEQPDENIMEELTICRDAIVEVLQPKYIYKVFPLEREGEELYVGNHALKLEGNAIKQHLKDCDFVALGCATLSAGLDELIDQKQKEDMLHSLLLDSLANAAIEEVRLQLEESLAKEFYEFDINWQFGIGYGDLPLSMQSDFLELINAEKEIGVRANESSILMPMKSVSGFIGLKKKVELSEEKLEGNPEDKPEETHTAVTKKRTCGLNQCDRCNMKDRCMFKKR